jgi:hypothetical protein
MCVHHISRAGSAHVLLYNTMEEYDNTKYEYYNMKGKL